MQTELTHPPAGPSRHRRSLIASSAGNWIEWYEWSAYSVLAPFIAAAMFSQDDPTSALLSTLGVFGVGFLMRPLGGIVFGRIADRRGRKFVLITTLLMMSAGSFAIAIIPTYGSIGATASLLLLIVRVVQGFAHGGESATSYAYVAEIAPRDRRGQWGSTIFMAVFGGSVLAYTASGTLTSTFGDATVGEWAWRLPFVLGGILSLIVLILRRGMDESAVFAAHDPDSAQTAGVPEPRQNSISTTRATVLLILLISGLTAAHYTWTSYVSTYAIVQQGMDSNQAFWTSVIVQSLIVVALPFWGKLSDRIGRRPVFIMFGLITAVTQYPMMSLISDRPWTLFVSATIGLTIVVLAGASLAAMMSEQFATHVRSQAIGFAYSISVAVFGGTAPYLNQLFFSLDLGWASSAYIIFLSLLTALAAYLLPETRGIDLSHPAPQTADRR